MLKRRFNDNVNLNLNDNLNLNELREAPEHQLERKNLNPNLKFELASGTSDLNHLERAL